MFYKAMPQMGGYLLPYDQLKLLLQLLEHENIDRAEIPVVKCEDHENLKHHGASYFTYGF